MKFEENKNKNRAKANTCRLVFHMASSFLKASPPIPSSPLNGKTVEVLPAQVKNHPQLAAILSSGATRELFLQYLKEVLAEENVSFWEHVEAYRLSGGGKDAAQRIVDLFLSDGADFEVNIDHSQKLEVLEELERQPGSPQAFDCIQTQIFQLLANDRYEKFRRHEIYHAVEACNKPAKKSNLAVNLAILLALLAAIYYFLYVL